MVTKVCDDDHTCTVQSNLTCTILYKFVRTAFVMCYN